MNLITLRFHATKSGRRKQNFLCMKFTAIFLLAACLQLSANTYSQQVTLKMKNVRIQTVFNEINHQTGFQFFYKDALLNTVKRISIDVKDVSLEDALKTCFKNLDITFSIIEQTIVVKEKESHLVNSENGNSETVEEAMLVKGKVTDARGNNLEGATVLVKETNQAVVSDVNGNFSIEILPGQTLLISYVGYEDAEYKVGTAKQISIALIEKSGTLKSVALINTGYQSLPKERTAGSFSSVSSDEIKNKTFSMNVIDRIEGLAPGLSVNYGTGNEKFLIRGLSSIQSSRSPLVVVDGVPIIDYESLTSLVNPDDVESVSILRDATATSIWGSAAANGVIVVTTKKGKTSSQPQRIKVRYSGFFSFRGQPDLSYNNMMNTDQFLSTSRELFSITDNPWANVTNTLGAVPIIPPHERIQYDLARGLIDASTANARFDSLSKYNNSGQLLNYLAQPSFLSNHSLSFDGGSQFHSYYGSMAYTIDKNENKSNLSRYQMNLRQDFVFSPAIKFDLITNVSYEKTKKFLLSDLPNGINNYLPYAMFADESGNHLSQAYLKRQEEFRASSEALSGINLDYVPLDEPSHTLNDQINFSTRINAGLSIKLLKGLSYEGRAQYQRGALEGYEYYDQNSYKVRNELVFYTKTPATPGGAPTYYLPNTGGHYATQNNTAEGWTLRNQLNYDKAFKKDHQLTIIAGTEIRNTLYKSIQTYRRGYDFQTQTYALYNEDSLAVRGVTSPVNFLPGRTTSNLLTSKPVTYTESEKRFVSAYSNSAYTFKRKYTINGSIRFDQSNLFGSDKSLQYKPIWSVGGAWNISKESFFDVKSISNLNLRITYGLGGNAPNPGFGGPYDIVSASNVSYFSGLGLGYTVLVPRNEKIRWERTATTNIGVDFSLFSGRIDGSIDMYKKITTDLLGYQPADPTSGWSYAYTNLGDIENKGIEVMLNAEVVKTKNLKWNTIFTLAHNKNKIISLKTASALSASGKTNSTFVEGYSSYGLFAYNYIGLDANGNPLALKENGIDTARRSADLTVADPVYMGTTQPLWYGGITNTVTYKKITFSFLVVYNLGNVMRRDVNQFYTGRLTSNIPVYIQDRWQNPGDESITDVPKYVGTTAQNNLRYVNFYTQATTNVISASYMKLRDLTVSYSLPKSFLSKISMADCSVYAQAGNIMLWRGNSFNIDPEYYNLRAGVRTTAMPAIFTIGFRTTFK